MARPALSKGEAQEKQLLCQDISGCIRLGLSLLPCPVLRFRTVPVLQLLFG